MLKIKIQPHGRQDGFLPYPFFIDLDDGLVGRQDVWKGQPYRLIGFSDTAEVGSVDLEFVDFLEDVVSAEGMYPVFEHKDGSIHTMTIPIMSARKINV